MDALARYRQLVDQVDRRFETLRHVHAAQIRCGAGCSDCCRARLSLAHVEAKHLQRGLARLPVPLRRRLARRAADLDREYCPALDVQGRCEIYLLRPLICRSNGVPLFHASREPLIQPPVVEVCDRNFKETPLKMLAAGATLNATTLKRRLSAIDADYCAVHERDRHERVPLAALFAQSASKPAVL